MRSRRYLVPVGIAGLIAVGTAIPHLTSASAATPDLPAITAQQLLTKVHEADVAGLSGTVRLSSDLGLTGLTGSDGQSVSASGFDPTSLLSGTTTFKVWDAGASEQRLALAPSSVSEIDVVRNGAQLWTSDSTTGRVTHYVPAARPGRTAGQAHGAMVAPAGAPAVPPTPAEAAADFLSSITPTTDVSVVTPVYVAGRPTYELRLAPKAADSTVAAVTIAVDAATWVPLQVQVTPKATTTPAVSLGFTSVSFSVPAASEFAPLVGTSEVTRTIGGGGAGHGHFDLQGGHTPGGTATQHPGAPSAAPHGSWSHGPGQHHHHGGRPFTMASPTTTGSGWGTVVTLHSSSLSPQAARELDDASTAVTLSNGTVARLVSTRLVNAVVLPDGQITAGFVTPAAVEAAAVSAAG